MDNKGNGYVPYYGNLIKLNTKRTILDSIGEDTLVDVASNYLDLLESSSAIYETNGDYALGIFSSGWCRFLDQASRKLCGTDDNKEALASGKWLCHESCWSDCAKECIEKDKPVEIECNGGIRMYGVPIKAGEEIVGAINFGYGTPPNDPKKIQELATKYNIGVNDLMEASKKYKPRTPAEIKIAKKQLAITAKLLGEIIARKKKESLLRDKVLELEIFNKAAMDREERIIELKKEVDNLLRELGRPSKHGY